MADNAVVKAGDLLVQLDDRDYRQQVRQARAALAASTASVQAQQAVLVTLAAQLEGARAGDCPCRRRARGGRCRGAARRTRLAALPPVDRHGTR
ncbi:biotin/lipoyl-binding protein [Pseudomonas qingdaonensis]|nr:biotin/lipoyl-binding protein [Pseudomonas qingdaonensis]